MNQQPRSSLMKNPLVTWVKTFRDEDESCQKDIEEYKQLSDGEFLHNVWLQIDPHPAYPSVNGSLEENGNRTRNLNILLNNIKTFYENSLGQILVLKLPDIIKIAANPGDESASCEEMKTLLMLILGSAVQCEQKEYFIDAIKQLDVQVQHSIVEYIQQITDNPNSVWLNSEWGELSLLAEDGHERERMYAILVQHVNRLTKERDDLFQRVVDLVVELETVRNFQSAHSNAASTAASTSPTLNLNSSHSSSPIIMNSVGDQKSHLLVELADVKSKLRRVQQELEEKNELVSEFKEILEQSKESCNKLRQDNLELIQEARSAKAYRDEIDVLNERVRKVDRLESEVQRYRDKMNELEFYKSRVEEVKEDNRILTDTKLMLEEQLEGSRKRADLVPELEAQILKLRASTNELSVQRDLDRNQIESLIEEIAQLRMDKKTSVEDVAQLQTELANLRCQIKSDLLMHNGEANLLEQINNDTSKRVLKLELENQRLLSFVENMKNNKSFNNNINNNNRYNRLSIENLPNGIDGDEALSPGEMSVTSDSPSVSMAQEMNAKLEKIESENAALKETINRLNEVESTICKLELQRTELENELAEVKSKRDADTIKYEQLERNFSQCSTENQRLQRLLENSSKRLEEAQHEIQSLESENQKLLTAAETLKSTMKRLNDLERDVTNFEAENHRLEQEKKSVEKEIARLKQAIEAKDNTIDEYASRMSSIERENKRMKKDNENNTQAAARVKDLERENSSLVNELFVCKKTVTTLRQDLVSEKIKAQHISAELERVNAALHKIGLQKCTLQIESGPNNNSAAATNTTPTKDWAKLLEDVLNNMVKKTLEQKESKICALENDLHSTLSKNTELNNAIESLRQRVENANGEKQPTVNHNLIAELQRKVTLVEDENKNLKNENLTQNENITALKHQITTVESSFDSLNVQNNQLHSQHAKLQVENSLLKSQNSSLNSQAADLQAQLATLEETKDKLLHKCEEVETSYKNLLSDHEALQTLHEQLTNDYETLSSNCSTLKLAHKNLLSEHKIVQEKLQAWLVSQDELQKMKDVIDGGSDGVTIKNVIAENNKLKDDCKQIDEEHKRLQTEYKMLQNIYKKLRSENNELKLKHTELQGETAECRDRMAHLDVEVSKLSNYCQMVALTNNSLESQRKNLITNMSNLLTQYHDMLSEIPNSSGMMVLEKMHDLCAKKEKLEKMIKEYDVIVEKKKVAVTAPNVISRSMNKSNTELCQSKRSNETLRSDPVDEAIYGKIWEAATPTLSNNTAVLKPMRNNSSSSSSSFDHFNSTDDKMRSFNLQSEEITKPERNNVISPPPRPPPRLATTIENKMTISVVTSPTRSSTLNNNISMGTSLSAASNTNNNFLRGAFKSNSINYGSPIRRQRNDHSLKNGHHHHFHHHHHHLHHPHSASPSIHSDSSLTPVEDLELGESTAFDNRVSNSDNVTVNSNTTNSIWYEYGCV